jgi:hypothetical protein
MTSTVPKPRYHTEESITSKIDAKRTKAVELEQRAWECEREAVRLVEEAAKFEAMTITEQRAYIKEHNIVFQRDQYAAACVSKAKEERATGDKLLRRSKAILEKHLPKLKNKLAEFRTPQIPAIDNGDVSIPVSEK